MDNEKNIKIPIKKIVENSAKNFGCDFNYDDMMYIRRFFIACLNLGFLEPEDLKENVTLYVQKSSQLYHRQRNRYQPLTKLSRLIKMFFIFKELML